MMICLHFHLGAHQLKYVCMGSFSFLCLSFFFLPRPKTQRNVSERMRGWEGRSPPWAPAYPVRSSSGFDASSILMSNQAFFYDYLWCRQCRNSNVPEREPSLCVLWCILCHRDCWVWSKAFSLPSLWLPSHGNCGGGVGGSRGRINSSRNGRCLHPFFENFRGGWLYKPRPFHSFSLTPPPQGILALENSCVFGKAL